MSTPAPAVSNDSIPVYDKYGREFKVSRDQWRTEVLPAALKSNWDDPDALYGGIVQALGDDFVDEALPAVERLVELEPGSARAATTLAFVRMKQKRIDEAHRLLEDYLARHGPDAAVLNNLAKVHAERNDNDQVERTLWRSLELDPNLENSFGWYAALHRERGGANAAAQAIQRVAGLPNAWLARMHLARLALDARDLPRAMGLYNEALGMMGTEVPATALMTITGDLGKRGFLAQLIELATKHYVPERHGVLVGNNLIKAYIDSGRIAEARATVERLFKLNRPDWRNSLQYWDAQLLQAHTSRNVPVGNSIEMTMYLIDGPVWSHPSSPVTTVFPWPAESAPRVAFLGCTASVPNAPATPQVQLSDLAGRVSRVLPLYLSEQAQFFSGVRVRSYFPWMVNAAGGSFVLTTQPPSDADAVARVKGVGGADFVVLTHLKADRPDLWSATLRLLRVSDGKCVFTKEAFVTPDRTDLLGVELAIEMQRALAEHAKAPAPAASEYLPPAPPQLGAYQLRLEQLLAIRCATSADALHGIREIVDGCLHLALDLPQSVLLRALLADVVARVRNIRPDIIDEYRERLQQLEQEHPLPEPAQSALHPMLAGA
jgi:tetratricopeptide (TPR) repeat protein